MKKIILLFSIAGTVLFTSCSNSDNDASTADLLVKKSIMAYESDGDKMTYTRNFTYDGNKLVNIIGTGNYPDKQTYTYTGDLITKTEWLSDSGVVVSTTTYEYNTNSQLVIVKTTQLGSPFVIKTIYVYNTNGTISATKYTGTATDQGEQTSSSIFYFTNGEVSKVEQTLTGSTGIYTYTYDDRNNIYKNITGLNKIAFAASIEAPGIAHNMVQHIGQEQGNNITASIQYTYNSDNYPVTSSFSRLRNGTITNTHTTQYFY